MGTLNRGIALLFLVVLLLVVLSMGMVLTSSSSPPDGRPGDGSPIRGSLPAAHRAEDSMGQFLAAPSGELMAASAAEQRSGFTITVSGTVNGPGGPLPDIPVLVGSLPSDLITVTTDVNGHYSATLETMGQVFVRVRPPIASRLTQANYTPDGVQSDFTRNFTLTNGHLLRVGLLGDGGVPFTGTMGMDVVPLQTELSSTESYMLDWDMPTQHYQAVLPPDVHYVYVAQLPPGLYDTTGVFDLRSADVDADLQLNTHYVPPRAYGPPDPTRIFVGAMDDLGEAAVVGDPGAVLPLAFVFVANLDTGHQARAYSAADGSFSTRIFAPPGAALLVRHGGANRMWYVFSMGMAGNLGEYPGTILHVPYPTDRPGVLPFSTMADVDKFLDTLPETRNWIGASWVLSGTLAPVTPDADPRHYNPGDSYRVVATLQIFGPAITATTPLSDIGVYGDLRHYLFFDAQGNQVPQQNRFVSWRLTPTGLPVEGGYGPGAWDYARLEVTGLRHAGPHSIAADVAVTATLPADLPPGVYRPLVHLNLAGVPTSSQWLGTTVEACGVQDMTQVFLPPITVGPAAMPRLASYILVDQPVQGVRGTAARQDAGTFALSSEIVTQDSPFAVPPRDGRSGEPLVYRLDPYLPAIAWANKSETGTPILPFQLPGGMQHVVVHQPDGSLLDLGSAPFLRSSSCLPLTRSGVELNPGTVRLENVYSLQREGEETARIFEQFGHYVINMEGFVPDIWGNEYLTDGTYDLWVAHPLDMDPGVLPGTPFEVGDAFHFALRLEPAVPADVRWTVVLLPNSDPAQAITHTVVGLANPYGYFAAADVFIWTEPGEYRVDVEAIYMAPNGELYMGAMHWGNVVATPNSPLEAHGRRGLDGLGYIAPAWFVNGRDLTIPPGIQHMYNPYYNGDLIWSRMQDPTVTGGDSLVLAGTVRDAIGEIEAAIRARVERCPVELLGPGTLEERIAVGEVPLFVSTTSCRSDRLAPQDVDQVAYSYRYSERPGVRVREVVAQEGRDGGYWRLDTTYERQLSVGLEGDKPNDFKFQYIGTVYQDLVAPTHQYNIQGTGWVFIPDDDVLGSRVMPPFAGPGNGGWTTEGGPIMTLKGRQVHIFILPTGTSPGQVLQMGDIFRFAGHIMPTLDSRVAYTVTAPSGAQRLGGGQANAIGYFCDPADDFVVDEPGLWMVDVDVWHDGLCSGGHTVPPYPHGDVLGSDDGRYVFYVVEGGAPRLNVTAPVPGFLSFYGGLRPITVTGQVPPGVTGATLDYTIAMPGFILVQGSITPTGSTYAFVFDPVSLMQEFPNLDVIAADQWRPGLADTFVIGLLLRGQHDGEPINRANVIVLQGDEVLVDSPPPEPPVARAVYLPLVLRQ